MAVGYGLIDFAHEAGRAYTSTRSREARRVAGQFMTPPRIAAFMAGRLVAGIDQKWVRVLEPSAGAGILAAALVEAFLLAQTRPERIELMLFEQDPALVEVLASLCERMGAACAAAGVELKVALRCEDFLLSELANCGQPVDGLITIANPPFFKLNKETDLRAHLHAYAVHGQPNAYGLFMAATARLTPANGKWCFIVPRSWMAGQYFKAVRHTMLRHLKVESLHAFESRRESFEDDAVLQETVIVWALGRLNRDVGVQVMLTTSIGTADLENVEPRAVPSEHVVSADEQAMITLPTAGVERFGQWTSTLATYGLEVSTGPVVAFRARQYLSNRRSGDSVPLLWLQHTSQQAIHWPIDKKSEHIRATAANAWMLLPNEPMVVMRRFSPKEDVRRVTCAPYAGQLPGSWLGLENHLNYLHRPGGRMSGDEVRGLSAFLASDIVDAYLRAVCGSTQINATDLRRLPLPPLASIVEIGRRLSVTPSLAEIDAAVSAVLSSPAQPRIAA